jgi:hypothetical protein
MNEWLDEAADALDEPRVDPEELGAVLKLAREVAHGVERRLAPVSAFLVGVAVGRRTASGKDRAEAFRAAVASVRALVPEEAQGEDG